MIGAVTCPVHRTPCFRMSLEHTRLIDTNRHISALRYIAR